MKVAQKQTSNDSNRSTTEATQTSWQNQLAQVANNNTETVAQRFLIAGINDSPRMLAQRRRIESFIDTDRQQTTEPIHPTSPIIQQPIQRLEKPDDEEKEPLQGKFAAEAPTQLKDSDPKPNNTGLPVNLKSGIESLSCTSMDNVKVHYNSSKPAQLNALAYAQGTDIHIAPGQERHLAHEAWHVVQQAQGRVQPTMQMKNGIPVNDDKGLEHEADAMGERAVQMTGRMLDARPDPVVTSSTSQLSARPSLGIQRKVRLNGGIKVKEADYLNGTKSTKGSKRLVKDLISDDVRRVFNDTAELEAYADGNTDYIGDVATASSGTIWYRLPKDQLTVLGESHLSETGNVQDVIIGLQTKRFMYEPFNEMADVNALKINFSGTKSRLVEVNKGIKGSDQVDRKNFNPDLENIVIKALTGAVATRNEFIEDTPPNMNTSDQKYWGKRNTSNDYSYGERTALYLSMGIHLAEDVSKHDFDTPNFVESPLVDSGRKLQKCYLENKKELYTFMNTKDQSELIGIYELTKPNNFKNLTALGDFALALHKFASLYIQQLGLESGNKTLESEGEKLSKNTKATLTNLDEAREAIMWKKIQKAKNSNYLIVGMGEDHLNKLSSRLDQEKIPCAQVEESLGEQYNKIKSIYEKNS